MRNDKLHLWIQAQHLYDSMKKTRKIMRMIMIKIKSTGRRKKWRRRVRIELTYRIFRYGTTDLKSAEPTSDPCASVFFQILQCIKLSIGSLFNQGFSVYFAA